MRGPQREQGFALIEAVVALAVIGVVSAMFLAAVTSSAQARRHVADARAATLVARSALDLASASARGGIAGRDGTFLWSSAVTPYPGAANGPPLEEVTVTVRDAETGRSLASLGTLRLAR